MPDEGVVVVELNNSGWGERCLTPGVIYRYPRPARPDEPVVDDLPNFYWHTARPRSPRLLLEAGISPAASVAGRRPAVLLRSSPHKANTTESPWEDRWDGRDLLYFGDNKSSACGAWESTGNRVMVDEHRLHSSESSDDRRRAAPILVFTGVNVSGRAKGNVRYDGLFVIVNVEHVWQSAPDSGDSFGNLCMRLRPVAAGSSGLELPMRWVNQRSDPSVDADECLRAAPEAWKRWVAHGELALWLHRQGPHARPDNISERPGDR